MAQNDIFQNAVQQLYFNAVLDWSDADGIINQLKKKKQFKLIQKSNSFRSLSITPMVNDGEDSDTYNYIFSFEESPFEDMKIDSGLVEIEIQKSNRARRVTKLEYSLFFSDNNNAQLLFDKLISIFRPISTYEAINDSLPEIGQLAEFSNQKSKETGIKNITILKVKLQGLNLYQVKILPYNSQRS